MRHVVGRRLRQRSEHNGLPASRIRGIRAPTEGRVSRFSWSKIAGGGQASQLSTGVSGSYNHHEAVARAKLLEITGHEVFRVDRALARLTHLIGSVLQEGGWPPRYRYPQSTIPAGHRVGSAAKSHQVLSLLKWSLIPHSRS